MSSTLLRNLRNADRCARSWYENGVWLYGPVFFCRDAVQFLPSIARV